MNTNDEVKEIDTTTIAEWIKLGVVALTIALFTFYVLVPMFTDTAFSIKGSINELRGFAVTVWASLGLPL